ncbi:MAG: tail fiber protein [bacterium]|nr:tail fiber protein [bacterium]
MKNIIIISAIILSLFSNTFSQETEIFLKEVPIGTVVIWTGTPDVLQKYTSNWLICDGSKVSKKKYPLLCEALSDNWGTIEGEGKEQTFTLPDLRGVFLRGVNQGREDKYADPDVSKREKYNGEKSKDVGSFQSDEFKKHTHTSNAAKYKKVTAQSGSQSVTSGKNKASINSKGGKETRPKNAYVYYIIKAR